MGNRMTVAHPYIIDEYPSDNDGTDDDDEDDYFAYESAYEALDQQLEDDDADQNDGNEVSVNSKVVNSLVKEVETLLTFLDKKDYKGAQKAARCLKDGGGGGGGEGALKEEEESDGAEAETEPLLQKDESTTVLHSSRSRDRLRKVAAASSDQNHLDGGEFFEQREPLLSKDSLMEDEVEDWTSEERNMLQQLELDLNAFEEMESRVVSETDSGSEIQPRRRKRKSSLPRLKPGATFSSNDRDYNGGGDDVGGNRSRESSLTRSGRTERSAIPRFCYKAAVPADAPATTTVAKSPSNRQASAGSPHRQRSDSFNRSPKPLSRHISPALPFNECHQKSHDRQVKGNNRTEAWEVNISDMTGRVKQNKKRSAIPSLWTQQQSPSTKTSPSQQKHQNVKGGGGRSPASPAPLSHSFSTTSTSTSSLDKPLSSPPPPAGRKVLDLKRWYCISRPQYQTSCGISSVVSCWNFLFSTLGNGQLNPVSQEEAMRILGYESPFDNIKFGPFTGNLTLLRWFRKLSSHFEVDGQCYIMYKPTGRNRTVGVTADLALEKLKLGLRNSATSFIYHCHNHFFCPVGFEETPMFAVDAYSGNISSQCIEQSWILCGDTSRKHGPIRSASWEDICQDLNCQSPEYFNIRRTWKGVMTRPNTKKKGSNLHCILCFQRSSMKSPIQGSDPCVPLAFHLHPDYSKQGNINNNNNNQQNGQTEKTGEEFDRDSLCGEEEDEEDIEYVSSEDDDNSFESDSLS